MVATKNDCALTVLYQKRFSTNIVLISMQQYTLCSGLRQWYGQNKCKSLKNIAKKMMFGSKERCVDKICRDIFRCRLIDSRSHMASGLPVPNASLTEICESLFHLRLGRKDSRMLSADFY